MKIRFNSTIALAVAALLCAFTLNANSQTIENAAAINQLADARSAVSLLREFYNRRDYDNGFEIGRKLVEKFPDDVELRAWVILNQARNEMSAEAVAAAKILVEKFPENRWAQFALAQALIRDSQIQPAAVAADKALSLAPADEEFIFLYHSALLSQKKYDEIFAFLDKNVADIKDESRLNIAKGETLYRQAIDDKLAEAKKKLAFEMFARAVQLNPSSVTANYIYAAYLNYDRRFAEALPLAKKAVALSPASISVREQLWDSLLNGQPDKSEASRRAEVVADITKLAQARPDSLTVLSVAAKRFGALGMSDKRKFYEKSIIEKFPASSQAEQILVADYRDFEKNNSEAGKFKSEKLRAEYIQKLRDFINRPQHIQENLLGDAYFQLFLQNIGDKQISDQELLELVENTAKYEKLNPQIVFPQAISALAARKMFREAEKIARQGIEAVRTKYENERSSYRDEKEYREALNWTTSLIYDALGWIFYKENRFDEAEKQLLEAAKLSENATVANHLGQLYAARKDYAQAERYFIKAYSNFSGAGSPNVEDLKSLYRRRHQNLEGFEAYFETVKVTERAERKKKIIADKIAAPQSAMPFNIKSLDGKTFSLADLKGKIVVVNFWGTWCGPCVSEMPEFQELHNKYLNDKDVVILTIDFDDELATIREFMSARKYDFAVLRDEKYVSAINVAVFPTTWFINREGKIAFLKVGSSSKLLEEFSWRIEELKEQNTTK